MIKLFVIDFYSLHNWTLCRPCCVHIFEPCNCTAPVNSGEGYPNKVASFGLNRAFMKMGTPDSRCTGNILQSRSPVTRWLAGGYGFGELCSCIVNWWEVGQDYGKAKKVKKWLFNLSKKVSKYNASRNLYERRNRRSNLELSRDVRNSKVRKQDKESLLIKTRNNYSIDFLRLLYAWENVSKKGTKRLFDGPVMWSSDLSCSCDYMSTFVKRIDQSLI